MTLARATKHREFRRLREKAGLTLPEAQELLKVDLRTIYRYERGETRPTRLALDVLRTAAERAAPPAPSPRDTKGREDRLNFGGVHVLGQCQPRTGLTLQFIGYDPARNRITDPKGGFTLADERGEEAATWHFAGLIEHWNRKHSKAAYVPFQSRKDTAQEYAYGDRVRLAEDTDFLRFLKAMADRKVYYDPGIKVEKATTAKPGTKRRSQFRIKSADIGSLYAQMHMMSVTGDH